MTPHIISPPGEPGLLRAHRGEHSIPSRLVRCECQGCGSHVHAVVLKQTISGLCTTCGSMNIARLKH